MNRYDKRLIERLRNWEKVYLEDEDTPEGNLYLEAAERIVELLVAYTSAEEELKEKTSKSNELDYTLDYDEDGLWLLQDGKQVSHIPQAMFDERIRQVIRQSKSLDQLAKYDQEDDLIEKEEPLYRTETISTDELTLRKLKYGLELCKETRDEMNKKRDMKGWTALNQEDWNDIVRDIHALERVIDFYGH
tara:strand:- start:35 stop:604 length:570 start_codon:yes stop_codon:yes gene_type:complete